MKILTLTILLGIFHLMPGQSYISQIYSTVLGNEDVKQEYKDAVVQALAQYKVANPEQVVIKKMNPVGSVIARMPLASFTAFGMWFDEAYLDGCSSEERMFQVYHEVAHYVQCHHQKVIASSTACAGITGIGMALLYDFLKKQNNLYAGTLTATATTLITAAAYLSILPHVVKHQEKEADLQACKQLCKLGRQDIIKNRIASLRASGSLESNIWWFSEIEQAQYLEEACNQHNKLK